MYRRQKPKSSQRGGKCEKGKWLSEEALQIAEERREAKDRGEQTRYPTERRVPENG